LGFGENSMLSAIIILSLWDYNNNLDFPNSCGADKNLGRGNKKE